MLESDRKKLDQVRKDSMRSFDYTSDMNTEGLLLDIVTECHSSEHCWVEADMG